MPFTVITLKNVPPSLRGDLTKWMQEISVGVYVGNFNSRVRDYLWERVCDSADAGEATMSYSFHNEIGYDFKTHNAGRTVIDSDGIPLVLIPENVEEPDHNVLREGFSSAYKMHRAHMASGVRKKRNDPQKNAVVDTPYDTGYVVIDLETTGLDAVNDDILEIGALKVIRNEVSCFNKLIDIHKKIPDVIVKLTGITDDMIDGACDLPLALNELLHFIGDLPLIGYNISFDVMFLNAARKKCGLTDISNRTVDLMKAVKREKLFQSDYKLSTSLESYGIIAEVPHRALEDAKLIYQLMQKVNDF